MKFYGLLFVVYVVFGVSASSSLLKHCSNNFVQSNGRNAVRAEWFKWAQFYSYCTQYDSFNGIDSEFDKECSSHQCQQCMKACSAPMPFNVENCQEQCGNSMECKNGCSFYGQLFSSPGSGNFTLDPQNKPELFCPSSEIRDISTSGIDFCWSEVYSPGHVTLSSVYLLIVEVKNNYLQIRNEPNKHVIGLTTDLSYKLSLSDICSVFSLYGKFEPIEARLIIQPINFNGWSDKEKFITSYVAPKKISSVRDVVIQTPPTFFEKPFSFATDSVAWKVTWKKPADADSLAVINQKVDVYASVKSCKDPLTFSQVITTAPFTDTVDLDKEADIKIPNPGRDLLRGCTVEVKITTRQGDCFAGAAAVAQVVYEGCETAINGKCPMTTTPKPTDAPIAGRSLSIAGSQCTSCSGGVCQQGSYSVILRWTKPATSSPIVEYQLDWGKPIRLGQALILLPKDRTTVKLPATATSHTISNVPGNIKDLAVQLYASSSTAGPFRQLDITSYEYLTLPVLNPAQLTCP